MTIALAFIECEREFDFATQDIINQVEGVIEAHLLKNNGTYDMVVKIQTEDETRFKDVVTALKSKAGIRAVQINIVYESSSTSHHPQPQHQSL